MVPLTRVVALSSIVALLGGGCAINSKQRTVATYAGVAVSLVGVGVFVHGALSNCEPRPLSTSDPCEEARHDRRNLGGLIAIGGVVAAIIAQLLPVTDDPDEAGLVVEPVVRAPIATDPNATSLRDPTAVKLAENARTFAAAGKCVEAFGSLKALRRIDAALADQLIAWDPTVSRCQVSLGAGITAAPAAPSGPPSQTPTTP